MTSPQISQLVPLDPFLYEDMGRCEKCLMEQIFIPVFRFDAGFLGYYLGCGHEAIVMFSRTTGEAA